MYVCAYIYIYMHVLLIKLKHYVRANQIIIKIKEKENYFMFTSHILRLTFHHSRLLFFIISFVFPTRKIYVEIDYVCSIKWKKPYYYKRKYKDKKSSKTIIIKKYGTFIIRTFTYLNCLSFEHFIIQNTFSLLFKNILSYKIIYVYIYIYKILTKLISC